MRKANGWNSHRVFGTTLYFRVFLNWHAPCKAVGIKPSLGIFRIKEVIMVNSDIARTFAAIVCTIVLSATCVLGAVAPAHTGGQAAASVARLSA